MERWRPAGWLGGVTPPNGSVWRFGGETPPVQPARTPAFRLFTDCGFWRDAQFASLIDLSTNLLMH